MDILRDPLHPPPLAADTISSGHILVTDCRPDATAAFGGSLLLTLLQVRRVTGLVTDAGLRDVEAIADLSLPCFAAGASAPTNLAHRHGVDIDLPIGGGGALVCPGDTVVGDGVIAVAAHLAEGIAAEVGPVEHFEDFTLAEIAVGAPVVGTYATDEAAQQRARPFRPGRLPARWSARTFSTVLQCWSMIAAKGEAARAAQILRFFAGEALRLTGEAQASVRVGVDIEVTREPIGVFALITPWNFRSPFRPGKSPRRWPLVTRLCSNRPNGCPPPLPRSWLFWSRLACAWRS